MGINKKKTLDERTLKMIRWSVKRLKSGEDLPPVADIAKKFDICSRTVRNHLGTIAEQAGVRREDLLTHPQTRHTSFSGGGSRNLKEPLKIEVFHDRFTSLMENIGGLKESIKNDISSQEDLLKKEER